jgi:hypothetical protein
MSIAFDLSTAAGTAGFGTARTRLRLTRRGRVVFTGLAAAPLIAAAFAFALNGGVAAAESTAVGGSVAEAFEYVTIQSGQSLWQLAESVAPTSDPREVIAEIVSLNQLSSENVQPGQRLALPNEY